MRPLYIFDLDGTLADGDHRVHHITGEKKDWRAYFAACGGDKPIDCVIRIFQALKSDGAECWLWTGRSAEVYPQTRNWLESNDLFPDAIRMRDEGDHRNDDILKAEWLSYMLPADRSRLAGVFEDRARVVKMWRDAGVPCFQVAPGEF